MTEHTQLLQSVSTCHSWGWAFWSTLAPAIARVGQVKVEIPLSSGYNPMELSRRNPERLLPGET